MHSPTSIATVPRSSAEAAPAGSPQERLIAHSVELLLQIVSIVRQYQAHFPSRYAGPVGSHLRHVIEHVEALLHAAGAAATDATDAACVAYDERPRDRRLETCADEAERRLVALIHSLRQARGLDVDATVLVRVRAGVGGEQVVDVGSTIGRELVFVTSHTVHHLALLAVNGLHPGVRVPDGFGLAPATLAHQRSVKAAEPVSSSSNPALVEESSCLLQ
jgi:hypothetical protein